MNTETKNNVKIILPLMVLAVISSGFIFVSGHGGNQVVAQQFQLDDQSATILSIKKAIPAVVSIIIYDQVETTTIDLNTGDRIAKKEKFQAGEGTGFLISSDGLILTNKHVVSIVDESKALYRVILNSGKQYYAQLIGKDPINDLAVIKIFDKNLPFVTLGDSDQLSVGTTVIAIGNALGQYQNSATKGIVSGLARSLVASDETGQAEALDNVIQTDAQINLGNSGGPLVDLTGKVIGINVATDQAGASIGFAIPINDAKPVVRSVREIGRIARARIGIRYIMLTPEIAQDKNLVRTSGALIIEGDDGSPAIMDGSPAQAAGLISGDIIFEINGIKIEGKNTLLSVVQKYKPGEKIGLKIQRGKEVLVKTVTLDEYK